MSEPVSGGTWVDRYLPEAGSSAEPHSDHLVSIAAIRGLLFRQRLVLGGIVGVVLLLGLIITLLTKPIYQASATVRVDPEASNIVQGQDLSPTIGANEIARYMETQGAVIKSRKMALQVVDSLKLGERDDILGKAVAQGRPGGVSEKQWQASRREMAAAIIQGGVGVEIPDGTRIITISFRSGDPAAAAQIANAYADNFVLADLRRSMETNAYAQQYLKEQIAQTRTKLQDAELAANAYAKANRIIAQTVEPATSDNSGGGGETITIANLASVNGTYTQARAKRLTAEQRWLAVASTPAAQLPEVQQNSAVQNLITERAKVGGTLSELRQRYGEGYPQVQELKAQAASLDRQISQTSNDIKNSIRNDYTVSMRQEQALSAELSKVSGQTMDEQDRRVRYNLLDREAQGLRTQVAALLTRYNEISSAANIKAGNISKLDSAEMPGGPVSPNLVKNMLISLVLGVGMAVGIAVLREAFDDRMRSVEDVEHKLGYPLLGQTPFVADEDVEAEMADPFSALMEAYSSIRTTIDFAVPRDHRVLQMTSSQASEGKSTTAAIIARKYAQLGRKTLLVDADLRRPSIAKLFNAKRPATGFGEVLLGQVELKNALLPDTPDNLDVLPVGAIPPNPVELLSSHMLADFIARYRPEYSVIIFDTSPVMGIADAPMLSRFVDSTIFMVEANRAHFGQAKAALRRLKNTGANVVGVVLTKFRALEAGQSYDYQYSYYTYGQSGRE